MRLFLIFTFATASLSATAQVYKWIDSQGQVHFSDKAPASGVAEKIGDKLIINSYPGSDVTEAAFLEQRHRERLKKEGMRRPSVVIYSTVWCGVCRRAKQYFKANNIAFREYDVETSSKGKKDFARMKGQGVPIILIGKARMNGFDAARFKRLYGA
ncbi:hypothetical protein A9Q89_00220 [Gammaproteobacteria bacterium 53_120_T64]|nr:hypothetical protein A9Q89_00220 [Gammaproteobacteria bacterium 53_120_T64]